MQGWKIIKHSFTQVFANMRAAIRVSAALFLVSTIVSQLWLNSVRGSLYDGSSAIEGGNWGLYSLMMLVSTIVGLWIAVAWHRYILTGEISDGWIPELHIARMLGYFLRGVLIFVVCMFMLIILGLVLAIIGAIIEDRSVIVGLVSVGSVLILFPMLIVGFRLSTILPAAALGKKLSLKEAWKSTKGSTGAIVVIALISAVLSIPSILLQPLLMSSSIFSLIWSCTFGWVMTMLGISLLTTFYGHYVEGRALND